MLHNPVETFEAGDISWSTMKIVLPTVDSKADVTQVVALLSRSGWYYKELPCLYQRKHLANHRSKNIDNIDFHSTTIESRPNRVRKKRQSITGH